MASQNTEDVLESLDFENMQTVTDEKTDEKTDPAQSDSLEDQMDFSVKSWREDMALVVEDRKLYVSSTVLSLMSPVFTGMFEEQFKEDGPKEIELHGKTFDDVAELLRCLYPNILKSITQDNVFVVLPLADEFKVDRLKMECENFLLKSINARTSPENIYKCLLQASLYKLDMLKSKAVNIAANMDQQNSGVVEGIHQLPLEVQIEIQNKQMEKLNGTVSKLKLKNATMDEECQNLKDCVKYVWPGNLKKIENEQYEVGVLVLPLPGVRTITETVKSTGKSINGIQWSVHAHKDKGERGEITLAIFLYAYAPKHWQEWTCEVHYKMLLMSQNDHCTPIAKCSKQIFEQNALGFGYDDFIKMQQLSDDKYVKDDSALIKVYLVVKQPWCKPEF